MPGDLKQSLIDLLDDVFTSKPAIVCEVLETSGIKCKVQDVRTETVYRDVRLQANPDNGVLIVPKDNSFIILQWLSDTAGYVAMYSAVDSIKLLDGSYGGLVQIEELVDKLNTLEQRMTSHQHLTGASAGAPTTYDIGTNPDITETTKADLENPDITHGIS